MKTKKSSLDWLQREIAKDNKELEIEKKKIINDILKSNPIDLVPKKEIPKKLTIWQRIMKTIMG
jgi:hypothetical protein